MDIFSSQPAGIQHSGRVWRPGPPPHVGWWNASVELSPRYWRWWNGEQWSHFALDTYSAQAAGICAGRPETRDQSLVRWTHYWPAGARVPRIDPGAQHGTEG